MGYASLVCAIVALLIIPIAGAGKYVAIGAGLLALGTGIVAYRRGGRARVRLSGATGITVATFAVLLASAKVGLTWLALTRIERLFMP